MRNRKLKDYTGKRYGRLEALALVERGDRPENNHLIRFRCDCGRVVDRRIKNVRSGHTQSCGCLARDVVVSRNRTHGLTGRRREYRCWKDMRSRCRNPNDSDYANYGGRGVKVCAAWDDFARFYADMGDRPAGHTLDRIDVNGDYEPGNCRWADARAQANNKRSNHLIEYRGETRTLQQWCDIYGLEPSLVRYRLKAGYSLDAAFSRKDMCADGRDCRD